MYGSLTSATHHAVTIQRCVSRLKSSVPSSLSKVSKLTSSSHWRRKIRPLDGDLSSPSLSLYVVVPAVTWRPPVMDPSSYGVPGRSVIILFLSFFISLGLRLSFRLATSLCVLSIRSISRRGPSRLSLFVVIVVCSFSQTQ